MKKDKKDKKKGKEGYLQTFCNGKVQVKEKMTWKKGKKE